MGRGNDGAAGTGNDERPAFPILVRRPCGLPPCGCGPGLGPSAVAPVSTRSPHGHQMVCTATRFPELAVACHGRERVQPATVPVTLGRPPPSPIRGMTGLHPAVSLPLGRDVTAVR